MNNNPRLYENVIEKLQGDTFYRQRFDACPHFMSFIGQAHTTVINKTYPLVQKTAYCRFSNDKADWYHSNNQLRQTADEVTDRLKTEEIFSEKIAQEVEYLSTQFYQLCKKIKAINLTKLSNNELVSLYEQLKVSYLNKLFVSALIDGFALVTDSLLHQKISDILSLQNKQEKANEYFEILTALVFISFLQSEELEFLKSLYAVKNEGEILESVVKNHQEKYFWMQNNYVRDNILDAQYFFQRADELLKKDLEEEIRRIESVKENKLKKKQLMKELSLDKDVVALFELTDVLSELQDERKKSTFWATHYFSLFLSEASRRVSISLELLKYTVPSEFRLLIDGQISEVTLQERKDDCIVLWNEGEYEIIVDKEKISHLDAIAQSEDNGEVKSEIKGMIAAGGGAIGRAKVVESSQDIEKVEEGDVIIAVMTRPDYLPAMKKAVAFVTDEGGITCHAAIVAREMKKPCIIGTKIATKVLKDGDLVEVDANKGIVRKV